MNDLTVIITLFGLITLSLGYDFQDELFNQVIKQDLDEFETIDLDESITTIRRRRDATPTPVPGLHEKCKKRRWKMCCGDDIIDTMMEKDRDLKKECVREVIIANRDRDRDRDDKSAMINYDPFSCEKINKTKKEFICVMECLASKKNIIDGQGNIKETELLTHYKREFGEEAWFYALIENAYPKCLEQVKNATRTFVKDQNDQLSCNPSPLKMYHCMWREIQLACPDENITDAKSCAKIREKIKKHDFVPFRHHHHHDGHEED